MKTLIILSIIFLAIMVGLLAWAAAHCFDDDDDDMFWHDSQR